MARGKEERQGEGGGGAEWVKEVKDDRTWGEQRRGWERST